VDAFSDELPSRTGQRVRLAGVIEALRTVRTSRDQTMTFLTLDDGRGLFEVTLFPDALRRNATEFDSYGPYLVEGRVEDHYGAVSVRAEKVALCTDRDEVPDERPVEMYAPRRGNDE
jgi:DNA polymerase III alpha subunit